MTFIELVNHFKATEEPDDVVPLLDDAVLRNGVVAWKSVCLTMPQGSNLECSETDPSRQWQWLWQYVEFDHAAFAQVAGVRPQEAGTLVRRLTGLRLVYPDGTINHYARQFLQAIIVKALGKRTRAPAVTPPEKTP